MERDMRIIAALVLFAATSYAAEPTCPPNPNWSYQGPLGPSHWVEHWPECGQGRAQSPINIPSGVPQKKGPAIEFHYQPFDLVLENTSHVVEVPVPNGSYITVGGHRYELFQFHFHTPSEHRFGGRASGLELHLVHRDAAGQLAVVAVLASKSATNPALRPIVTALPVASCEHREQHEQFDAATLLPATRDYVTYGGSLTTPGCDEGVTWLVLTHAISASAAQRAKLGPFGVNARPVQLSNGRPIVHVRAER
jgi:carbonic anhydrase